MSFSAQEITSEILTLPEQEQQEVVDFVGFLKAKLIRRQAKHFLEQQESQTNQQSEEDSLLKDAIDKDISPIYQAFEQAGLIGCIESDEQLSSNYKEKVDFSFKHCAAE
jgi:transcriptional regulator of heat shock response